MSKKTPQAVETPARETPAPTGALTWSDWFDHWPDLFARRWPDTFRNMPFGPEMFRLEQFFDADGTLVVRGEMPGIDPEADLSVTVDDDRLVITGERREHEEFEDNDTYRSEFQYGSFERSVRLPAGARTDDVTATYRDGILEVRVPVTEVRERVTTIPVRTT